MSGLGGRCFWEVKRGKDCEVFMRFSNKAILVRVGFCSGECNGRTEVSWRVSESRGNGNIKYLKFF